MAEQALDTLQINILAAGTNAATAGLDRLAHTVTRLRSAVGRDGGGLSGVTRALDSARKTVGNFNLMAQIKGITTMARTLGGIGKKIQNFVRSISRIAMYRAIRSAIKAFTQGLNEGIQSLYQWSLLVDRTFANSMDSIATSMQYLRNGFASMFSPLINYAAPIIEEITNKMVDFFNVVQQIFAALTGQSTWTKAIRVQKQYAEAVTDTGKAADKAMHQVMAFDELNIINSPQDSGRSGNKDNTPDYASMFETQEVDTALADWVQTIKDFFESGRFRELGAFIADQLNGLLEGWDAQAAGYKLGLKIRHMLETINGFLEEFHFDSLGAKVVDWIWGLVDGINVQELLQFFINVKNAIVDFVIGAVNEFARLFEEATGRKFAEIGAWLSEKLNALVQLWETAYEDGKAIGDLITAILTQISDLIEGFDFAALGAKIAEWFIGIFDGLDAGVIIELFRNVLTSVRDFVSGFIGRIINEWKDRTGLEFDKFGSWVAEKLNAWISTWQTYESGFTFGDKIRQVLTQVNDFLRGFNFVDLGAKVGDWIAGFVDGINPDDVVDAIVNAINGAIGFAAGLAQKLQERGVPQKIGEAIGRAFGGIKWETVAGLIESIVAGLISMFKGAVSSFINDGGWERAWEAFKNMSLPAQMALAIPLTFSLVGGTRSLLNTILGGLGIAGITGAESLFLVTATGLTLALTIEAYLKWKNDTDIQNPPNPTADLAEWVRAGKNYGIPLETAQNDPDYQKVKELATNWSTGSPLSENTANYIVDGLLGKLEEKYNNKSVLNPSYSPDTKYTQEKTLETLFDIAPNKDKGILGNLWDKFTSTKVGSFIQKVVGLGVSQSIKSMEEQAEATKLSIDRLTENYMENNAYDPNDPKGQKYLQMYNLFGHGGGGGGATNNKNVAQAMWNPFKGSIVQMEKLIDQSTIPNKMYSLVERSGNNVKDALRSAKLPETGRATAVATDTEIKAAIDAADLPGKARTTANSAGTSMKDAITAANVPGRFRETALASISEFGKQDFASAGRQAGGSLRTGFDSGGVVSTVTTAAANAMAAFRNAAWASTGATAGATLGRTFKDHFVANAKSTLMLQTAAGKPITQAYVVPYANGGYVQGSLFLAGEVAGQAEMVGSINGRTGVASGEEITGIREAVDRTGNEEAALLRQTNVLLQALLAKDPFGTPNSAAGRWIAQSQQAYGKVTG